MSLDTLFATTPVIPEISPDTVSPWTPAPVPVRDPNEMASYHPDQPNPFLATLYWLLDHGWTKGGWQKAVVARPWSIHATIEYRYCLIGAAQRALGAKTTSPSASSGRADFDSVLRWALADTPYTSGPQFNDHQLRFAPVERLLRRCAAEWERRQGWLDD